MAAGRLHFGAVSAFAVYVANIVAALVSLGWVLSVLQRGTISLNRILEMMQRPDTSPPVTASMPESPLSIRVNDLHFSYGEDEQDEVLKGMSFTLEAGQTLGIFGSTGSGKTTLLRLLTRLETPPPDTIFYNGVDIRTVALADLRRQVAIVPQTPYLLSRTLRENIAFGRPDEAVDAVRLQDVVQRTCLDEEVARFQDGLDTVVGERGVMLSGGQRQRTTLARALYRESPLLILDDTLAAVDHDTEQRLIQTILGLGKSQTLVFVSHRMSVLAQTDHIIVLDDGRIAESGRHAELVEQGGIYTQAWRTHMAQGDHHE